MIDMYITLVLFTPIVIIVIIADDVNVIVT